MNYWTYEQNGNDRRKNLSFIIALFHDHSFLKIGSSFCHVPNCKEGEGVYNIEKFLPRLERRLTYDFRVLLFNLAFD